MISIGLRETAFDPELHVGQVARRVLGEVEGVVRAGEGGLLISKMVQPREPDAWGMVLLGTRREPAVAGWIAG